MVSNPATISPEPETPVKTVILRRGMSREMFLQVVAPRAPRTSDGAKAIRLGR